MAARPTRRLGTPTLRCLIYYDPEYAYDVGHEYEDDWTTDPDHSGNGIEFAEYDEDGVLEPIDDRRTLLEGIMLTLLPQTAGQPRRVPGTPLFPRLGCGTPAAPDPEGAAAAAAT